MAPETIVKMLSRPQRDMLLDHCCGPVPVAVRHENFTRDALLHKRLIRGDPAINGHPQETILTSLGKQCACILLGQYADALDRTREFYLDTPIAKDRAMKLRQAIVEDINVNRRRAALREL